MPYKPPGTTSVAPYLLVEDAPRYLRFLAEAFDGEILRRFDRPDGALAHAEVRIDDTVVMLAEATAAFPAFPVWLHVFVPDVDAAHARALAAGARSIQAPMQEPHDPDRRGGIVDPAGHTWWLTTLASA